MPVSNYYVILGVGRNQTPREIRNAYLELAKRHHPDRVGQSGKQAFQDIQEAYETLSDPEKRRLYNHELDRAEKREVLRPVGESDVLVSEPISIFSQPESIRPSIESLYERWLRNFTGVGVPKGERIEGLNIEIVLTAEEAAKGVIAPIEVPTFHRCPFCDGIGFEWVFPCTYCRQEGMVEKTETVRFRIPPLVRPGTLFEMPLRGLGIHNIYLRLHVFVE
jgi:DnaJ-class molecular chaperone